DESGEAILGTAAGNVGTVTVTGSNAHFHAQSALTVGNSGAGFLNVSSGAHVNNVSGFLATNPGSAGTATISGANSTGTQTALFVGGGISAPGGIGAIVVQSGGVLSVFDASNLWASSSITINGGTFTTGSLTSRSGAPSIFLSDPSGGVALTVGSFNPNNG